MTTSTWPLRRRVMGSAAALLCLAAVAAPEAGAQTQAQAQAPLRIGVLTDMSSLYADITGNGSVVAAQMAVEDFTAGHKMRPVEVLSADHLNKADIAASLAREWIDTKGVDVIVDLPNSAVALAVNTIARDKNKAMLVAGASTSDLTGKACSPNTVQWTYDTYALAVGTTRAVVGAGDKTWFALTADYAFGQAMESDVRNVLKELGGTMVGSVRTPLNTQDFASFLLQAQASPAKVVSLINAGGDTINSIKQATEFGLTDSGKRLVAMVLYLHDVHSLGLKIAQGLQFTAAFYWDLNDQTRQWSKRFAERNGGKYPSQLQAGVYAEVLHYLKAVEAAGGDSADGKAVVAKMKELPTDDPLFGKGSIRVDGRKLHDMYLFEVKTPAESNYPWDYYKVKQVIPSDQVWRPLKDGGCPLVGQ
ncbi:ABC transporter substrate-binding protein [Azospirillum picis]|uniref:Branched-chain amino acid transport system substrate-binding protein n=1 Tax=Azospirillum picis TaxID=488438 RepID=A0ABU0MHW0_9PROT|nr:ABC transporter substrate-binding protein [Azospirillum picis]MBP2299330.1 branched-chain amino acid transport system substrate-binding protein [Azospirillum picis]MDQ0533032.1 branched-chain amino acid transport system substrate-binding protein [Azospirillum picis]